MITREEVVMKAREIRAVDYIETNPISGENIREAFTQIGILELKRRGKIE